MAFCSPGYSANDIPSLKTIRSVSLFERLMVFVRCGVEIGYDIDEVVGRKLRRMKSEAISEGMESMAVLTKIACFLENMVWAAGSVEGSASWIACSYSGIKTFCMAVEIDIRDGR